MSIDFNSMNPEDAGPTQVPLPPEEIAKRKTGWQALLDQWHDPNVRSAIVQTGIGLMRSPQYGQSGWDVGANALQAGVGTLEQLRERDRLTAEKNATIARNQAQTGIENKRADTQVATSQQNAATQSRNVDAQIANEQASAARGDKTLAETTRHNKASEVNDASKAAAANTAANARSAGRAGKTSAEIEKINRLGAYYKQQNPDLSDQDADKMAIDYVTNSKGKPPRQMVVEAYQAKAKQWFDQQFDPNATPPPDMVEKWKKDAVDEIRSLEGAGQAITDHTGQINRPGQAPAAPAAPPAAAVVPSTPHPATLRSIDAWKAKGGTPEQIKILIATGGEDPKLYGY